MERAASLRASGSFAELETVPVRAGHFLDGSVCGRVRAVAMVLSRRPIARPRPPSPARAALEAIRARREHEERPAAEENAEPRPVLPDVASAAELAW